MLRQKCRPDPDVFLSIVKRKDLTLELSLSFLRGSRFRLVG